MHFAHLRLLLQDRLLVLGELRVGRKSMGHRLDNCYLFDGPQFLLAVGKKAAHSLFALSA